MTPPRRHSLGLTRRAAGHEYALVLMGWLAAQLHGLEGVDRHRRDIAPAFHIAQRRAASLAKAAKRCVVFVLVGEKAQSE